MIRGVVVATAVASLSPLPAAAQCPDGTPPPCEVRARTARVEPPPPEARARSFLVLPFRNLTGAPEHEWLVQGSVAMLVETLGQWQEIHVVPERTLVPALRRHGLTPGDVMDPAPVRRIARETGGWTVVTGDILTLGATVRIRARTYDAVTDENVASAEAELTAGADPRPVFAALALELIDARNLEPRLDWVGVSRTTRSIEAYRAAIEGLAFTTALNLDSSEAAFRRAIALDSTFGIAYAGLATVVAARVAILREFGDEEGLFTGGSQVFQVVQKAVQYSSTLPPRERQLIRMIQAMFRADLRSARSTAGELLLADSTDVMALGSLASLELFDPVIQPPDGEHRRGSVNRTLQLAKRALLLDPGRLDLYYLVVRVYREAAGYYCGWSISGIRHEPQSLLDFLGEPDRYYVPVLMDTLELVPKVEDSLRSRGVETLLAARVRAAEAAQIWVEQWLATAPADARAWAIASSIYELQGEFELALEALRAAERLWEGQPPRDLAVRRLVLLGKLARDADAMALLDSIGVATGLEQVDIEGWFPRNEFVAKGWAVGLLLKAGRPEKADSVFEGFEMLPEGGEFDGIAVRALTATLPPASSAWWSWGGDSLPGALLRPALDSLLAGATRLARDGRLAAALPRFVAGVLERRDADHPHVAANAARAAIALAQAGRVEQAQALARAARDADSAVADMLREQPWYREPGD